MSGDMVGDMVYAVADSEIGKARCLNCGQTWGEHAGIRCQRSADGDRTFQPLGFALSDRCGDCGKTLLEHYKRVGCFMHAKTTGRIFTRCKEMFTDEEFLL